MNDEGNGSRDPFEIQNLGAMPRSSTALSKMPSHSEFFHDIDLSRKKQWQDGKVDILYLI